MTEQAELEKTKQEENFLLSRNYKQINEGQYKWESPSGQKFIYSWSAHDWQKEKDEIAEKGYKFKIGTPYSGFGWGIFVRIEGSSSYKMLYLVRDKADAQEILNDCVASYSTVNKAQALTLLIEHITGGWSEELNYKTLNKIILYKHHYGIEYFSIKSYTELVNWCIHFVNDMSIRRNYKENPPVKPAYEWSSLPVEFQKDGKASWENYESSLKEYSEEQQIFEKLKFLKELPQTEYRKYHLDFVNFVLRDAREYYGEFNIEDAADVTKYI